MITATDYREENKRLMQEYEERVRNWLSDEGDESVAKQIPFFRDGVTCPEVWFQESNLFRPLFVLKEVSLGVNSVQELQQFLEKWGHPQHFEFVENPFDDIKVGTFPQWRRIARLAKGLEEVHNGVREYRFLEADLGFRGGGETYNGDIQGYKEPLNYQRTANVTYNEIINKIAVLEIKKVGAGQAVNSELSRATKHYTEHIEPFRDLLCRQIKLIDPTVIICLGREQGNCTRHLLKDIAREVGSRIWIDGYHHAFSSNLHFYEEPMAAYKQHIERA